MDELLMQFLSLSFVMFSLGLAGAVFVLRKCLEYFFSSVSGMKLYNELLLPVAPVLLGGVLGLLVKMYPYPDVFTSTLSRVFFGGIAGMCSSGMYRVLKAFIVNKEGSSPSQPPSV